MRLLQTSYRDVKFHQNIVNLAEQHGKEGAVTKGYRENVHEAALKDVQ